MCLKRETSGVDFHGPGQLESVGDWINPVGNLERVNVAWGKLTGLHP